jgi:hypothetical protein
MSIAAENALPTPDVNPSFPAQPFGGTSAGSGADGSPGA